MPKGKDLPPRRFLTVKEAAALLSLSPKTVYRMHDNGELPGAKFGGAVRLCRKGVEEYIARQLEQGNAKIDRPAPPPPKPPPRPRPREGRGRAKRREAGYRCLPRE
jgi:excisionase family DNA binding protein